MTVLRWLACRVRARSPAPPADAANIPQVPSADHDFLADPVLPEVVDENSEVAWARWHEALEASRNWDSETQPLELRPDNKQE